MGALVYLCGVYVVYVARVVDDVCVGWVMPGSPPPLPSGIGVTVALSLDLHFFGCLPPPHFYVSTVFPSPAGSPLSRGNWDVRWHWGSPQWVGTG